MDWGVRGVWLIYVAELERDRSRYFKVGPWKLAIGDGPDDFGNVLRIRSKLKLELERDNTEWHKTAVLHRTVLQRGATKF